ncbi:MAG: hypothetical protein SGPRY_007684 [Prymnesium sp.]
MTFLPPTTVPLPSLQDNDFFGERSVLSAWEKGGTADLATATCECVGFCDMLKLDFACFAGTLENYGISAKEGANAIKDISASHDMRRLRRSTARAQSCSGSGSGSGFMTSKEDEAQRLGPQAGEDGEGDGGYPLSFAPNVAVLPKPGVCPAQVQPAANSDQI